MPGKKEKAATPKAPPVVYVEIGTDGTVVGVNEYPGEAEDSRDGGNRLARYILDSFVEVNYEAVVTDID